MNNNEIGFRSLYRKFATISIDDNIRKIIKTFPQADKVTHVLTYGYIDHEAGLTLEILTCAAKEGETFNFFASTAENRAIVRADAISELEIFCFGDDDEMAEMFKDKIENLKAYDVTEDIEKTRQWTFLDSIRHPFYPDDIQVPIMQEGLETELCWLRLSGGGSFWCEGTLLNEPNQDFGYHKGDHIHGLRLFDEQQREIVVVMTNPLKTFTHKEFEDGTLLKEAISRHIKENTYGSYLNVLELLRDSVVWIPFNMVLSEEDQKEFNKTVEEAKGHLDSLVGKTLTTKDAVRFVPDILTDGENSFFPVFTSQEEMGEYGNKFSKLQNDFLEVIKLARNNEADIKGIVINGFSEQMIITAESFAFIEQLRSRLIDNQ